MGLVAAACGSSSAPSNSIGRTSSPGPASTSAAASPRTAAPASNPPAAAGDLLAAALEPLRVGSSFETSVTVDDAVVVSATGRTAGAASEMSVTTAGRTVDYVRVPPKAWAREPGASWVPVVEAAAPGAPLDTLSTPSTLVVSGADAGVTTFTATYAAATLGLTGDPVTVTITVDGTSVRFTYEASASGRKMTSTTTLRPAAGDAIVAPA
jgi:hypothetical protein